MENIREDDKFFELGVSSLTIIELQLAIEEELGVSVPTSELMRLQTMKEWIEAYGDRASQEAARSAMVPPRI
ncbi:hypothetical protein BTJ49_14990 [Oleiagrimonas sp. MCCC 1A03011]|nr:hypothetical protein BTJ49_14990 [Oleiagrimonas sp. MCCC 1A03011]